MEIDFVKTETYRQTEKTLRLCYKYFRLHPWKLMFQAILVLLSLIVIIGMFPV